MALLSDQATQLLDFSKKLDINLLETTVDLVYNGSSVEQKQAQDILTRFQQHSDAWTRVDAILAYSNHQQTKYYALQVLESAIKIRWKVLPRSQCDAIKIYIVGSIVKISSDPETLESEKVYITKLNMILVQILKREWPHNWPTFIADIVESSKTNESLCQNNMMILKLLSEEVFDFSKGQITRAKAKHLKHTMCDQSSLVIQLCVFVFNESENALLVNTTLETLLKLLNWIPIGYIFEFGVVSLIIDKFSAHSMFRNVSFKCLTEIASVVAPENKESFVISFKHVMAQLDVMIPVNTDIKQAYAFGNESEQNFIQNLSLFLCTFLKGHASLLETYVELNDLLTTALHYLVLISEVDDIEIFKICLEYWNTLVTELYHNISKRKLYQSVLSKVRWILIGRMAKPTEVLVVENDQGGIVRIFMKDTDSMSVYKNMRETLVYLTHLDCDETIRIMVEKLDDLMSGKDRSWRNLSVLCWAIGSISGTMSVEVEKSFFTNVILDLVEFCETKIGLNDRAMVASNMMYIVGQYPRYLKSEPVFLGIVIDKLFEFMHEDHDGIQETACDTFVKIAKKCRHQVRDVEEILDNIEKITRGLQTQYVHSFYEAVGYLVSAQELNKNENMSQLIGKFMFLPNKCWNEIVRADFDVLRDEETVRKLENVLKMNTSACKGLGHVFYIQLKVIYGDMLNVYKVLSANISAIAENVEITAQPLFRSMQNVRKEILKLVSCWVVRSNYNRLVADTLVPSLLSTVLVDYQSTVPSAREPEVLSVMAAIVNKLPVDIASEMPMIFYNIFESTFDMINKDFEQFPEHRINFYLFLKAANDHGFLTLLKMPTEQFKFVLDSIIWAFKHTAINIADIGLNILHQMFLNVAREHVISQKFYQTHFVYILRYLFLVVTDSLHVAGLAMHAKLLGHMISLVKNGRITVSLDPMNVNNPSGNINYIQTFITELLQTEFTNLNNVQITVTVRGLFELCQDILAFKGLLRDFLVQIKEFAGEDGYELLFEDQEAVLREAQEKKRRQMNVPGVLNPYEIDEEMN